MGTENKADSEEGMRFISEKPIKNLVETFNEYCQRKYKYLGLSSFNDPQLPDLICSDSHTPENFLALYAMSTECDLLEKLAANPNTPIEVLAGLAFHYETSVRAKTASNAKISITLSESLAIDESLPVRFVVASNPQSSARALKLLQTDLNKFVANRAI